MSGLRRGVAISTFGNLFAPIVGLVTAPILAQSLGVVGRGELAAATTPLLLAASMLTLGLPEALTFYIGKRPLRNSRAESAALVTLAILGALGTIGIWMLAPLLAAQDPTLESLIVMASLACTPALLQAGLRGIAFAHHAWWLITADRMTTSTLRLVVICTLAALDQLSPTSATLAIAWTSVAGAIVYGALPFVRRNAAKGSATEAIPNLFAYAGRIWIGSLAGILLSRLDQSLMVPLSGAYALGIYVVAVTVSEIALIFNAAVRDVTFSLESSGRDDSRLEIATRVSTVVTALAAVVVGLASIWAIPFFFGSNFADAVPVLLVILVGLVLGNPGSVAGAGLRARGRPGLASWSLVIGLLINVAALIILVPQFGALGAALARAVGSVAAGGTNIFWLRAKFGVPVANLVGFRASDVAQIRRLL